MANPPVPVIIIPVQQFDTVRQPFSLYYGGGYAVGYTWHLSIIDAGEPRGFQGTEPQVSMISMRDDPFGDTARVLQVSLGSVVLLDRRAVTADREEGAVAERELAVESGEDVEAEQRDGVDQHLRALEHVVS